MVKRTTMFLPTVFLVTALVFLLAGPVHSQTIKSDSKLTVSISKTDKQWGQFLRVTMRYRGPKMMEDIDLQSWQQIVGVDFDDEYSDEDDDGNSIQVLQLRLHPRTTGKFQLPSLRLGTAQSQPIDINISPSVIKNSPIKVNWQTSTLSPWQREAVLIRVQVHTEDYAAHIKLDTPEHKQFVSRVLKTERQILANGSYRFNAGWILYPIDSGLLELDLPPVRYQIAGSDRRQFYLPLQKFHVKTLPNYLPPTLPVGKVNVSSQISHDKEGNKQWQLSIKTDALIPYGVPELDTQLATISEQDVANIVIKYTQQSSYNDYGDLSIYSSPMPDWLMPFGKKLKLRLRFFDTENGHLSEISHDLPRHWNMPTWAWWITVIMGLITGYFILRQKQTSILGQATRLQLRYQLHRAENIKHMRKIILDCGSYITLSEWDKNNQSRKRVVHKLNRYCFSASGTQDTKAADLQKLKTDLLKLV